MQKCNKHAGVKSTKIVILKITTTTGYIIEHNHAQSRPSISIKWESNRGGKREGGRKEINGYKERKVEIEGGSIQLHSLPQ